MFLRWMVILTCTNGMDGVDTQWTILEENRCFLLNPMYVKLTVSKRINSYNIKVYKTVTNDMFAARLLINWFMM